MRLQHSDFFSNRDSLSRRDFLRTAVALGAGAMIEMLLCKQFADVAQNFVPAGIDETRAIAQNVATTSLGQNVAPAPAPAALAASAPRSVTLPDLYAGNTTQIEQLRKGDWQGLFYLGSDLVGTVAKQYDIPADLIHALLFRESSCIPTDRSKVRVDNRYSYAKGAVGLGQVMYFHAQEPDGMLDLTHMPTNLIKTAQLFNAYRQKYSGDSDWVRKTLYDYNAGPNRTTTPPETVQYAEQIVSLWKDPSRLKSDFLDKAWSDIALMYWDLLPTNPLLERFVRTGVEFWEPYEGQPNHTGLDLGGPRIQVGVEIRAVADGRVAYAGKMYDIPGVPNVGRGNAVVLEHRSGNPLIRNVKFVTTGYCHMSDFAPGITAGKFVERGQVIGYIGMTGWTMGPHLHFECAVNTPVNTLTRKMAREDGWFHPFLMLPPNQAFPGSKKLA
ncbi:MAG: hypothetical protein E6J26_08930 [Chloroflexi bacterium]|nr:MAG: hypothetical protein E6J26_08930 [Chloroflexota bacterium]